MQAGRGGRGGGRPPSVAPAGAVCATDLSGHRLNLSRCGVISILAVAARTLTVAARRSLDGWASAPRLKGVRVGGGSLRIGHRPALRVAGTAQGRGNRFDSSSGGHGSAPVTRTTTRWLGDRNSGATRTASVSDSESDSAPRPPPVSGCGDRSGPGPENGPRSHPRPGPLLGRLGPALILPQCRRRGRPGGGRASTALVHPPR